jgi:hypothetical protein
MRCSCRCDEIDPSEAFSSSSDMFTKTDEANHSPSMAR